MTETTNERKNGHGHERQPRRQDGHLTIYLLWPLLAGLGLAAVLAVSVGGLVGILGGWDAALLAAAITFFSTLGLATILVFIYAMLSWAGPAGLARLRQTTIIEEVEPTVIEQEPRFIRMGGRPKALNAPPPALPSGANRGTIRQAIDVLADRLTDRSTLTLATDATPITPDALPWVKEFYATICAVWPKGSLSRRTFEATWPGGQGKRLWTKYVNGTGHLHSQAGIWSTWGIISQTGSRKTWEFTQPLDVIFSLDQDLGTYARAMAAMVQHSPAPGQTKNDATGQAQTGPDRLGQTKGGAQ